jgi:hypothetical protein
VCSATAQPPRSRHQTSFAQRHAILIISIHHLRFLHLHLPPPPQFLYPSIPINHSSLPLAIHTTNVPPLPLRRGPAPPPLRHETHRLQCRYPALHLPRRNRQHILARPAGLALRKIDAEYVCPQVTLAVSYSLLELRTKKRKIVDAVGNIVRAEEVDTDEPFEVATKNISHDSPVAEPTRTVADGPAATDFEEILQDVRRERGVSDATSVSTGSQKLSQRWQGALRFASAVGFFFLS